MRLVVSFAIKAEVAATVEDPRLIVLARVPELKNCWQVTEKLLVVKVPLVTVTLRDDVLRASPSVTVMPDPLTIKALKVLPAVVRVAVPVMVTVPVLV